MIYAGHCKVCKRGWTHEDQRELERIALEHCAKAFQLGSGPHEILEFELVAIPTREVLKQPLRSARR